MENYWLLPFGRLLVILIAVGVGNACSGGVSAQRAADARSLVDLIKFSRGAGPLATVFTVNRTSVRNLPFERVR